jgi:Flp pilus assembly protein TadD
MLRIFGIVLTTATLALPGLLITGSYGAESRWIRLRSSNFEMYTSAGSRGARDTIREFEQVRGFFLQAFKKPPSNPLPVRLVVFGSQKEYAPYAINEFATAYYHQNANRDYIVMSRGGADTFPIAVHEYVHLLVRHAGLNPPPWLNEGVAELYSTLRPMGNKILVGDLIAGRYQALLQNKWIPLSVILAVDQNSPYYNEKSKAGGFYNESWALTHMLFFRAEYRDKFGELLQRSSSGEDSAKVLQDLYGRPAAQIEKDLQSYLHGNSFQGAIVPAKLDKDPNDIPVEELPDFDKQVVLADLLCRPGNESAAQTALETLVQKDPKRPEPYHALGYLAWQRGDYEKARQQFSLAFERGDRDPKLLWDYGRMQVSHSVQDAITVLSALLSQDPARTEVRLALAEAQLTANQTKAALNTVAPIHAVSPGDAERLFRIAVFAYLRDGDQKKAEEAAKHFRDIATTEEQRAEADRLLRQATDSHNVETEPVSNHDNDVETGRPLLRRSAPPVAPQESQPKATAVRPSVSGRFTQLDCLGKQARIIVETGAGKKVFLIEDPGTVAISTMGTGSVEMACGHQAKPKKIEVGYDPPPANQKGLDGVVRTIEF